MLGETLAGAGIALITMLPLAWKWELGIRRAALAVLLLAALSGLALSTVRDMGVAGVVPDAVLVWLLCVTGGVAILLYRFYRDPERRPPARSDVVVSPADGEVVYVRQSAGGRLPVSTKHGRDHALDELTKTPLALGEAVVVGIALSFLDVHVNRAPVAGRVASQRHHKGVFRSLKRPESVFENERATTVIERDGRQVAVVLIASRLVRRIVTFVQEGDEIACGQRIGAIRFGSQVDLVLPSNLGLELCVEVGDRLRAGESVVAVVPERRGEQAGRAALRSASAEPADVADAATPS